MLVEMPLDEFIAWVVGAIAAAVFLCLLGKPLYEEITKMKAEKEGQLAPEKKKKFFSMRTLLIFIIGLVVGGWLFYCLFPNTAISKDTLREATEKFEEAQAVKDEYGLGKNYFETPIEYGGYKMFKVAGVLENGDALATEVTSTSHDIIFTTGGAQVVLEHSPDMPYYDSQVVSVPKGKAVMQLGVYRCQSYGSIWKAEDLLSSGSGSVKTLPLLAFQ